MASLTGYVLNPLPVSYLLFLELISVEQSVTNFLFHHPIPGQPSDDKILGISNAESLTHYCPIQLDVSHLLLWSVTTKSTITYGLFHHSALSQPSTIIER
jgi:hypothetical protein